MATKLSISLTPQDVATLDRYMAEAGLRSRSAVVQHAIRLLDHPTLADDYAAAWDEWADSGEASAWETTVGDGTADA